MLECPYPDTLSVGVHSYTVLGVLHSNLFGLLPSIPVEVTFSRKSTKWAAALDGTFRVYSSMVSPTHQIGKQTFTWTSTRVQPCLNLNLMIHDHALLSMLASLPACPSMPRVGCPI